MKGQGEPAGVRAVSALVSGVVHRLGRFRQAPRAAVGALAALFLGVLAGCCSAHHSAGPPPARYAPPVVVAASPAVARAANRVAPDELNLETFTPLLALPRLHQAARALELGKYAEAGHEVEQVMAADPPIAREVPRWQYLLAQLREQAGDLQGAAASFGLAAMAAWPLREYAEVGVGRVSLRSGQTAMAEQHLASVEQQGPVGRAARALLAETLAARGAEDRAIVLWRAHLADSRVPDDWHEVSLRLARALLAPEVSEAAAVEALHLARRVRVKTAGSAGLAREAAALELQALQALPPDQQRALGSLTTEERLMELGELVRRREWVLAGQAAENLRVALTREERSGTKGCEAEVLRAKCLAGTGKWGAAADALGQVVNTCRADRDQLAKVLYLAAKYAASDGRSTVAVQRYAELEREVPEHSLADDARLNAAMAYLDLGVEARFVELLSTIADDYPNGDRTLEGVFRLALRRIQKGDWSSAANVLGRATELAQGREAGRGAEYSGRETYFYARSLLRTGEPARGAEYLERLIREVPLSYYMLAAYTHLAHLDAARAHKTLEESLARARDDGGVFERRAEFSSPGFLRAMELLRVGDPSSAQREIDDLGFGQRDAQPAILWGVAMLYDRAGATRLSHGIARWLLTDWLERYPDGIWRRAWEIAFPRPYRTLVALQAQKHAVPESLVYAVMREESAFDRTAVSPANAYGLMQLIVPTARHYAEKMGLPWDPDSLKQPAVNIALGCCVLADLTKGFAASPELAIPGYNAGPGRPRRWVRERPDLDFDVWVELIPFEETRRYTKRVLASRATYAFLFDSPGDDQVLRLPLRVGAPPL